MFASTSVGFFFLVREHIVTHIRRWWAHKSRVDPFVPHTLGMRSIVEELIHKIYNNTKTMATKKKNKKRRKNIDSAEWFRSSQPYDVQQHTNEHYIDKTSSQRIYRVFDMGRLKSCLCVLYIEEPWWRGWDKMKKRKHSLCILANILLAWSESSFFCCCWLDKGSPRPFG